MTEVSALAGRLEAAAHAGDNSRARMVLRSLEEHLQVIVAGLARVLPPDGLADEPDPASPPVATAVERA